MSGNPDRRKKFRAPDRQLALRIERGQVTLDELFDDAILEARDTLTELLVVEAFAGATALRIDEFGNREFRATPGRIIGAAGHIESLAEFILQQTSMGRITKQLVRRRRLSDPFWELHQNWYEKLARHAVRQLIVRVLLDLRDGDEWCDSNQLYWQFHDDLGCEVWAVPQSVLDRLPRLRDMARELAHREELAREGKQPQRDQLKRKRRNVKRDDRSFHGRANRDRKGRSPGASCGSAA